MIETDFFLGHFSVFWKLRGGHDDFWILEERSMISKISPEHSFTGFLWLSALSVISMKFFGNIFEIFWFSLLTEISLLSSFGTKCSGLSVSTLASWQSFNFTIKQELELLSWSTWRISSNWFFEMSLFSDLFAWYFLKILWREDWQLPRISFSVKPEYEENIWELVVLRTFNCLRALLIDCPFLSLLSNIFPFFLRFFRRWCDQFDFLKVTNLSGFINSPFFISLHSKISDYSEDTLKNSYSLILWGRWDSEWKPGLLKKKWFRRKWVSKFSFSPHALTRAGLLESRDNICDSRLSCLPCFWPLIGRRVNVWTSSWER